MTVLKHFRKVGKNRCDQHQKNNRCKHRFIDLQHIEKLIRHKVSDLSGRQVLILPDHRLNKILKMQFFFREQFPDCRIQILYLCQLPDFLLCFLLRFFPDPFLSYYLSVRLFSEEESSPAANTCTGSISTKITSPIMHAMPYFRK